MRGLLVWCWCHVPAGAGALTCAWLLPSAVSSVVSTSMVFIGSASGSVLKLSRTSAAAPWAVSTLSVTGSPTTPSFMSIGGTAGEMVAIDNSGMVFSMSPSASALPYLDLSVLLAVNHVGGPLTAVSTTLTTSSSNCLSYARIASNGSAVVTMGDMWHTPSLSLMCLVPPGGRVDLTLHTALEFDVFAASSSNPALAPTVSLGSYFGASPAVPIAPYIVSPAVAPTTFPTALSHVRIPLSAFYPATLSRSGWYLDSVERLDIGNTSISCSDTTPLRSTTPGCDSLIISNVQFTVRGRDVDTLHEPWRACRL